MKKLLAFLACLVMVSCGAPAYAQNVRTFIPEKAKQYAPMLREEQIHLWPDHPAPWVLGGLVEQESCISLTHSRCWSPTSKLKTAREEGAGLGQITRAYRADGSLRFDKLNEMVRQYPKELAGWNWGNVYATPHLQLKAIVLLNKSDYDALKQIKDPMERLRFADAAYNGGRAGVDNDRRLCGLKKDCDPQKWKFHVENTCSKSKAPIYGNRSACDINRTHVENVLDIRSDKYKYWFTYTNKF